MCVWVVIVVNTFVFTFVWLLAKELFVACGIEVHGLHRSASRVLALLVLKLEMNEVEEGSFVVSDHRRDLGNVYQILEEFKCLCLDICVDPMVVFSFELFVEHHFQRPSEGPHKFLDQLFDIHFAQL